MAQTAVSAVPGTGVGDGRVSAFYAWTEHVPERPGKLLRGEDHADALLASLPDALAFVAAVMAGRPAPSGRADLPA